MAFIDYEYFKGQYPNSDLSAAEFGGIEASVERYLDAVTTTIDNVHKLTRYFPAEDTEDRANVMFATAMLVNLYWQIDKAASAYGLVQGADGYYSSGVVQSRSSGSESVSFGNSGGSLVQKAAQSDEERDKLLFKTARIYLSGVSDSNGVNLLYGGVYPYVQRHDNTV